MRAHRPTVAKDYTESSGVARVVSYDIDSERLRRCSEFVGSPKFEEGDRDMTVLKVKVKGRKGGAEISVNNDMVNT